MSSKQESLAEVSATLARLEKEDSYELAGYLIDLIKTTKLPDHVLAPYYEKYLYHKDPLVRKGAVFGLLFVMKLKHPVYRNCALKFVNDKNEDENLRAWSMSSLSQVYTHDDELIAAFYHIFSDESESIYIRQSALRAMLAVYGISGNDISGDRIWKFDTLEESFADYCSVFKKEIEAIKNRI